VPKRGSAPNAKENQQVLNFLIPRTQNECASPISARMLSAPLPLGIACPSSVNLLLLQRKRDKIEKKDEAQLKYKMMKIPYQERTFR